MSMIQKPYHKYVFDTQRRKFIGDFKKMYENEDRECYDSWCQENLTHLVKKFSLSILNGYNFDKILDIGCRKGTFTHLLKKANNLVKGIDISETAIKKARAKYKDIEFQAIPVSEFIKENETYDLVVRMEILSYLKNWKDLIAHCSKISHYMYISLYLPPNPIGFVKTFKELRSAVKKYFNIEIEVLFNRENLMLLCRKK